MSSAMGSVDFRCHYGTMGYPLWGSTIWNVYRYDPIETGRDTHAGCNQESRKTLEQVRRVSIYRSLIGKGLWMGPWDVVLDREAN